ncbi:hypothetical protein WK65_31675 [Burkholderia ubonensis]|nr:hypothetical protein WK65_31675 [Burkholderia ubonensis]
MRQIPGFMEEPWQLRGLEIAVPSFWQLSERFATLTVPVQQRGERLADRLANGEAISLIVNSTGMGRASEWHRQKSGRDASRTPWRKVHLSIDPDMNMHTISVTETTVSAAGLHAVLAVDAPVDCVIADGAYYRIAQTEAWSSSGVPPASAVVHAQPAHAGTTRLSATSRRKASMRATTRTGMTSVRRSRHRSRRSNAASARGC